MEPVIRFRNLGKKYGHKEVLMGIDLDIYPGQVIGYIGPNGAGKSTTVKILCGLLQDFTGEVIVKGMNLKSHSHEIKLLMGYVPETAEIYEVLTPKEFLILVGTLYGIDQETLQFRIDKILEAIDLGSQMDQRMDSFSKGMKQKVLISSALLSNPEILILDEPLSGLDANSVIVIKELMQKLAQEGKTIFYCSHMMDIVEKVSHNIVLIDKGKVIAKGTFEALQQQLGSKTLEQMFASLTSTPSHESAAGRIFDAMHS